MGLTVGGEGLTPLFSGASPTFRLSGHNRLNHLNCESSLINISSF